MQFHWVDNDCADIFILLKFVQHCSLKVYVEYGYKASQVIDSVFNGRGWLG
jgi:hypothetical protein